MAHYHLTIGGASTVSTRPGPTNTGATGTLTILSGNQYIDTPDTLLENLDIYGRVIVRTSGVTIRNCRIRAAATGMNCIDATNALCSGLTIEDCTLRPDIPSDVMNGVNGHDFTATGCDISAVVDGFGVWNNTNSGGLANVVISGNYLHDFNCVPTTTQSDGHTHNDGVQIHGNGGVTIRNNTFQMNPGPTSVGGTGCTAGVLASGGVSPAIDNLIEDNFFDWSAAWINIFPGDASDTTTTALIRNNRFGRNPPKPGDTSLPLFILDADLTFEGMPTSTGPDTNNGNVFDDTGDPVTIRRW